MSYPKLLAQEDINKLAEIEKILDTIDVREYHTTIATRIRNAAIALHEARELNAIAIRIGGDALKTQGGLS